MNQENLIDDKKLRERFAGRIDVLDKVKTILLLPRLNMMTVKQIADYYEVDSDAIQKCYRRNIEEIKMDGVGKMSLNDLYEVLGQDVQVENMGRAGKEFHLSDDVVLHVSNFGILLFPKRAVLRIGMLLRDSEVAKEVRTQLLNIEENSTAEEKTYEIDLEMEMCEEIVKAFATGSMMDMLVGAQKLYQYQHRHILELIEENTQVKESNELLSGEILHWDNRQILNKAVRTIASRAHRTCGSVWGELYDELRYKHGISLSQRGEKPWVQYIRDDEWMSVQQSLAALCDKFGVSSAEIMEKVKFDEPEGDSEEERNAS